MYLLAYQSLHDSLISSSIRNFNQILAVLKIVYSKIKRKVFDFRDLLPVQIQFTLVCVGQI